MTDSSKVLFVGDLNAYSKGLSRLRATQQLGARIKSMSHTAIGGDEFGQPPLSLAFRVAWKLGIHLDTENVSRRLLHTVPLFDPDLIWVEKGNMIAAATLARLKASCPSAILASYTDDDMFAGWNRTRAYAAGLRHYDIVFTTKSYNANPDELPAMGAKRVVVVDKAYDPDQHFPIELNGYERAALGADVGFIGSYAPEREMLLRSLASTGVKVRVWGNGWVKVSGGDNLCIEGRPLINVGERLDYTKAICATRINLGLLRKANRDLQTDRSIEIPACGGFLLAEQSPEHEQLFVNGREAAFFTSPNDLVTKIRHYLVNEDERVAIAAAGRRRCIESGYSHKDRMRVMLSESFK